MDYLYIIYIVRTIDQMTKDEIKQTTVVRNILCKKSFGLFIYPCVLINTSTWVNLTLKAKLF